MKNEIIQDITACPFIITERGAVESLLYWLEDVAPQPGEWLQVIHGGDGNSRYLDFIHANENDLWEGGGAA